MRVKRQRASRDGMTSNSSRSKSLSTSQCLPDTSTSVSRNAKIAPPLREMVSWNQGMTSSSAPAGTVSRTEAERAAMRVHDISVSWVNVPYIT